jgi:hypothetical protein
MQTKEIENLQIGDKIYHLRFIVSGLSLEVLRVETTSKTTIRVEKLLGVGNSVTMTGGKLIQKVNLVDSEYQRSLRGAMLAVEIALREEIEEHRRALKRIPIEIGELKKKINAVTALPVKEIEIKTGSSDAKTPVIPRGNE